jgi:hypothetical protein
MLSYFWSPNTAFSRSKYGVLTLQMRCARRSKYSALGATYVGLTLPSSFTYGQGGNCAFGTRVSLLISVICFIFHLSNLYYVVFVCIS